MSPVCKVDVLEEVSDDVDAQEKTDGVLVGVFSRGYEMGRVVPDVGAEVVSDLEFEAGVLAGDGKARKRKREDELGQYPVNTRVRREMDLSGFATRGPRAKMQKRKRRGPVKFPGFERPEELTWEHVVAAGGVPGRVGGARGIGGAAVEASTMGVSGQQAEGCRDGCSGYRRGGAERWKIWQEGGVPVRSVPLLSLALGAGAAAAAGSLGQGRGGQMGGVSPSGKLGTGMRTT